MTTRSFLCAVVAVFVFALAGCGDGDEASGVEWNITLRPTDGGTLLDTPRVDILFEGARISEPVSGTLRVAGPGTSSFTLADGVMTTQYANNTATIQFGGTTIVIADAGRAVRIGELVYQLEGDDTNIVIAADGTTRIEPGN